MALKRALLLWLAAGSLSAQPSAMPVPAPAGELVVLVHGMGRTAISMWPVERVLEGDGYRVLNFQYNSYGPTIAEIGRSLRTAIDEAAKTQPVTRVHFVGHSLGNIVVRYMVAYDAPAVPLGRMVMLAPPNRGAKAADLFAPYVSWLLAPITELRTTSSTVATLPAPPPTFAIAIVAGADDRTVSVEETCLAGARAHVTVPSGHTFIMTRGDVADLVRSFLATGAMPRTAPDVTVCGRSPQR
jgi:predicted alpha/beta hydrolase family esterase